MQKLNEIIKSLDGKAVSSYSKLYGRYERNGIVYHIRNVYGGQFKYAAVTIELPCCQIFGNYAFDALDNIALTSHIMREFSAAAHMANDAMQQSESNVQKGFFLVYQFGTRVLPNSAVQWNGDSMALSLTIKLPYNNSSYSGGSVMAQTAQAHRESLCNRKKGVISAKALKILLTKNLPQLVENFVSDFDIDALINAVALWHNQEYIRWFLKNNGYVSFVANGASFPRKGKSDYKDTKGAVPFIAPESMKINITLPNGDTACGMGIPKGITLITGDAYHGKSTILEALKEGVYNHVLGDGREYVITDESAMTIQAEDGRSIKNTDISFFLQKLPIESILPKNFSTDNASGSTSQAAAVTEAFETGCRLMLFDEDRSANNFMYKDEKMRSVIKNASTVPFLDNARMFYQKYGISSVIVVGASGEYFRIADKVILVENFVVSEYNDYSKEYTNGVPNFSPMPRRVDFTNLGRICLTRNIEIKDDSTIKIGNETVDVAECVPHATRGQLDFICSFIYYLTVIEQRKSGNIKESVLSLYKNLDSCSLEMIHQTGFRGASGVIEYVRPEDILSILYRLKSIAFKS